MKKKNKGFVVSAVLYPLLVLFLALIMGLLAMSDTRKRILDKMKLEISDSIFDEATCSCDTILNKLNYLIKNGVGGGGGGGLALNLNIKAYDTPSDMPFNGEINDIAIIETSYSGDSVISTTAPSNPKEEMIWIAIKENSSSNLQVGNNKIPLGLCYQYVEGEWKIIEGYIYNGGWVQFSSKNVWELLVINAGKKLSDYSNMNEVAADNEIIEELFKNQNILNYTLENSTNEFVESLMNNPYFMQKVSQTKTVLIYIAEHTKWLNTMKSNINYSSKYVPLLLNSTVLTNAEKFNYGYPIYIFNNGPISDFFTSTGGRWSSYGSASDCSYSIGTIIKTSCYAQPGSCTGTVTGSSKAIDVTKYDKMVAVTSSYGGYSSFGLATAVPNKQISYKVSSSGAGTIYINISSISGSYYPAFLSRACFGSSSAISYYATYTKVWFE